MSQRERDGLKVLHEVQKGQLSQKQGAAQLGLTDRWVGKLRKRRRAEGDRGIVHGRRGRPSNRQLPAALRQRAVARVKDAYRDFGPTLAMEYLAQRERIGVSKETRRQGLIEAGVWKARPRRVKEVHTWRPRRACGGELVQGDTSEPAWLEGRGEEPYLIILIDDATNRLEARLVRHDSTPENQRRLKTYLQRWGRPVAFYTDQAGLFQVNRPANPTDAHRPLGPEHDLAAILSVVEERVVTNDYTLRYQGKIYQIARADLGGGLRGAKVGVEKRLHGSVAVRFRERYLAGSVCAAPPPPKPVRPRVRAAKNSPPSSRPRSRPWMEGFSLKNSPPLWKVLKQESGPWASNPEGQGAGGLGR